MTIAFNTIFTDMQEQAQYYFGTNTCDDRYWFNPNQNKEGETMDNLINKYGKELLKDLLDIILISKSLTREKAKELLLKHKKITQSTKTIHANLYISATTTMLYIKNGRGSYLVDLYLTNEEVKGLKEKLQ